MQPNFDSRKSNVKNVFNAFILSDTVINVSFTKTPTMWYFVSGFLCNHHAYHESNISFGAAGTHVHAIKVTDCFGYCLRQASSVE